MICTCSFVETTDTQSYIRPQIHDSCPDLTSYRIWLISLIWRHQFITFPRVVLLLNLTIPNKGSHGAFATGLACRMGTLTPPDTLFCPTFGLACVLMSRQIFPELVLFPNFWVSNFPRYFCFALTTYYILKHRRKILFLFYPSCLVTSRKSETMGNSAHMPVQCFCAFAYWAFMFLGTVGLSARTWNKSWNSNNKLLLQIDIHYINQI